MFEKLKKCLEAWCDDRDTLLMKQQNGDKPGEYRPMTRSEVRAANPGVPKEIINYLYDYELECWDLKEPDPIISK